MDMSRVGLAGQAYTKVPEFAKAFGDTGLKINLSLITKGVDKDGKLICEKITSFDEIPRKLWIKFPTMEAYEQSAEELFALLADSDGKDSVIIYIEDIKAMKKLPPNKNVCADEKLFVKLSEKYGKENIKIVWDVKKD